MVEKQPGAEKFLRTLYQTHNLTILNDSDTREQLAHLNIRKLLERNIKYQVAKVSPGGSFAPFAPLAMNLRICKKAANLRKGHESAKRLQIHKKAANP